MKTRPLPFAPLLAALSLVAACAAPSRQDLPMPDQEVRLEDETRGRVYVMRARGGISGVHEVHVIEDRTHVGTVGPDHYLCWEREPGRTLLRVQFKRPDVGQAGITENVADLQLEAGEVSYWLVDTGTQHAKPRITRLSQEAGRELLAEKRPAKAD